MEPFQTKGGGITETWILKTAWPMATPTPYSSFHILFTLTGVVLAVVLAFRLRTSHEARFCRILFLCGLLLAVSELYKQLFLYAIADSGHYDWWYFPFQLCSLPMYLCLLWPFVRRKPMGTIFCTFMQDFALLGGIMALAEPSGLLHPYWTLTIHGLLWHVILIFISLFIAFSGRSGHSVRSYLQMLPLFGVFCIIAALINALTKGAADMFYISPYYPMTQVVFDKISIHYGIGIGIMVYLLSICLGGLLCHLAISRYSSIKMSKNHAGRH